MVDKHLYLKGIKGIVKCVCVWVPHDHVDAENDDDGENDSVADDDVEGSGWVAGW